MLRPSPIEEAQRSFSIGTTVHFPPESALIYTYFRVGTLNHRVDVIATHTIASMANLLGMLDAKLPVRFTTHDIARTMESSRRLYQQVAFCIRESGMDETCGKDGNALVYRRMPELSLP